MRFTFATVKRILTILLAFVYLLVSSGVIMELHHCMGKLAGSSVSFFGKQQNDKCDNCGMEDKKNDCCKDEVKLVKIQDSTTDLRKNPTLQAAAAQAPNCQSLKASG